MNITRTDSLGIDRTDITRPDSLGIGRTDSLPHHRLVAYAVAVELLVVVRDARLRDAGLREQALKSAKSACLNIAEGAGRVSQADKARVFGIARAEVVEACAAVELAGVLGATSQRSVDAAVALASRAVALLTGLMR